ncbi:MAG: hypothetical protein ACK5Z5_07995 [Neisseriaceae bacterium]|jgi:hypothetical protein
MDKPLKAQVGVVNKAATIVNEHPKKLIGGGVVLLATIITAFWVTGAFGTPSIREGALGGLTKEDNDYIAQCFNVIATLYNQTHDQVCNRLNELIDSTQYDSLSNAGKAILDKMIEGVYKYSHLVCPSHVEPSYFHNKV